MRRKTLLILSSIALAAVLFAYLTTSVSRIPSKSPVSGAAANDYSNRATDTLTEGYNQTSKKPPLQEANTSKGTDENWASDPLPPGRNLQERLEELSRRKGVPLNVLTQQALTRWSNVVHEMSQQVNHSIEFYGKAVDESGQPIKSANVRFSCVIFPESYFATNVLTDAQGKFMLADVSGAILNVQVNKDGYEEVPGTNQNSFSYSSAMSGGFVADAKTPVIFHLRKKQ